jgi:hypothetical protein
MICTIAPVAAPVVKPMMSGEPSALREIDWKIAPAMPSAAPTQTAVTTRGRRRPQITRSAMGLSPLPNKAATTSAGAKASVPVPSRTTANASAIPTSTAQTSAVRGRQRSENEPSRNVENALMAGSP